MFFRMFFHFWFDALLRQKFAWSTSLLLRTSSEPPLICPLKECTSLPTPEFTTSTLR